MSKRSRDFPDLTHNKNNRNILKSASIENPRTSVDNAKLSKKCELASDLNDCESNFQVPKQCAEDRLGDQTLTNVEMYAKTELQSEPQVIVDIMPDLFDGEKLTSKDTNFNELQNDWWQATCEPVLILSSGNGKHLMDWWEMSIKIFCISCITVNAINEKDSNFSCVECGEN